MKAAKELLCPGEYKLAATDITGKSGSGCKVRILSHEAAVLANKFAENGTFIAVVATMWCTFLVECAIL